MRKGKLWFLIPGEFDRLEFAYTLKNAAENMIESEKNISEGWQLQAQSNTSLNWFLVPKVLTTFRVWATICGPLF